MSDVSKNEENQVKKIQEITGYSANEIALVKNTIAKGTTNVELAYFLSVAKATGLNPFLKEIWCYKDSKNNVIVFAGRDGFLKKAQDGSRWNGMTSAVVCENDYFKLDMASGEVSHIPDFKDRGKIIGAYAISKPKGADFPTIEWADFTVYDRGFNVWKTDPMAMIKKVAETHCLKIAYGITGLQSEFDYDIQNDIAIPVDHSADIENKKLEEAMSKIISALESYTGDDKEMIREMCVGKRKQGEFTMDFAQGIATKLGIEI